MWSRFLISIFCGPKHNHLADPSLLMMIIYVQAIKDQERLEVLVIFFIFTSHTMDRHLLCYYIPLSTVGQIYLGAGLMLTYRLHCFPPLEPKVADLGKPSL